MEKWLEKRSIHTMNLRSVFTAEQQRILERYYENGMTNQSKSCFQLILQCAQETKLDFSVVRNRAAHHGLSLQHIPSGAAGPLLAGSVLTAEMAAMRNIPRGPSLTHLLPPQASSHLIILFSIIFFPSQRRIYPNCFDGSSQNRTVTKLIPFQGESEWPPHDRTDPVSHHAAIQRKAPVLPSAPKPLTFRDSAMIPPNWAKPCRTSQPPTWLQTPLQKTPVTHHSPVDGSVQIQRVFTMAGFGERSQRPPAGSSQEVSVRKTRPFDASEIFSIAMETADADDEYLREEELANMAVQIQSSKASVESRRSSSASSSSLIDSPGLIERSQAGSATNQSISTLHGEKGCQTGSSLLNRTTSPSNFPLDLISQASSRVPYLKVTSDMSVPWHHSNSRKRTLQDRTQFSDRDVYTLKRYWDNGMTSLGSLCKEKISAAANQLSMDIEIVKTWIGNRRRKYRLMGIEIPPPKGGPITFSNNTVTHSPHMLEDDCHTGELPEGSEHNDAISICLSDDGGSDFDLKENYDKLDGPTPAENVKIEINEDDDGDDGDMLATEVEQMQNLLEFKNEEVQFLENELLNQKQKFSKLKIFTQSLLIAVRDNDRKRQQELLDSLPQKVNQDWDLGLESHTKSRAETLNHQKESSVSEEEVDCDQMRR
ncbi:hypothetical protein DNTS_031567 [Danionella cerebrum]|uniref:Homeobox domain-containing protein n=1 Tax=Danionella cerebrum TaxID=2873325 RepID=A0A553QJF7_9TELE|nr:hypothetical protein DNTS_031567 [Danionella translucida]